MPFNPKFTLTPKIDKALVEIERLRWFLDACKIQYQTASELETLYPVFLDKTFKGGTVKYTAKKSLTDIVRELLNYKQLIAKLKSKISETESKKAAILDRYLK